MLNLDVNYEEIHGYCLEILEETGIQIKDQNLHNQLLEHGVDCDKEKGLIRFRKEQVEEALKLAPKKVILGARDPSQIIELTSEERLRFMPSGTGVAVIDAESHLRRPSTSVDVEQFVRVQQQLSCVDVARPVITATDLPPLQSDIFEFLTGFRFSTKHFHHRVMRPANVKVILSMAEILSGGKEDLRKNPLFSVCYCPISPLSFVPEAAQSMLAFASRGIPVLILSMAMGGATAPATPLGEAILVNAEILAGITLIQTLYPGSPVMYGSVSSVMDMSTAILALGAPERGLINGILARMANTYGIPCVMGGLSSDSKFIDVQAGFEKALTAIPLLDCANLIFGLGVLNSGNTYSLEQLVLDADLVGALKCLSPGKIETDGRKACDLIKKIGPLEHYLMEDHTLEHFREFWRPQFLNRSVTYEPDEPGDDTLRRVREYIKEQLKRSKEKMIDERIERELESLFRRSLENTA